MSGSNPNIILGFQPTQNVGPDFGKMVANSQQLLQLRQQQQQVQQQNALLGVFQNPDAVDPKTGMPTADTLGKVTSINPQLGLQMRQNVLVSQDQQMKRDAMMGKEAAKNADRIADALSPVVENYQTNIKGGMSPEQANQKAAEEYKAAVDQLGASGFDPNRLKQAPPGWDPVKVPMLVERTKGFRDWQKEQLAAQKQDDLAKRYGQMGQQTMQLASGETVVFHPGEQDPKKQYTFANTGEPVPPEKLGGLTKTGTGAGSPAKDKEKDDNTIAAYGLKSPAEHTQEETDAYKAAMARRQAGADRVATNAGAATKAREDASQKGQDHAAIEDDVKRQHPEFNPAQVAEETKTREKLASTLPGSVAADRAAIAADVAADPAFKGKSAGERADEVEHRYQVARTATMDKSVADNLARQYVATGNVNVFSGFRRNTQMMNQIEKSVIEQQTLQHKTPEQVARGSADFAAYTQGVKAFEAGGKLEPVVRSQNVAVQHLGVLQDAADKLNNDYVQAFNSVKNRVAEWQGLPAPTDFNGVKRIVGEELVKAILGSSGALGDRDSLDRDLNAANSPQQLTSLINRYKQLMAGQLSGMRQSYDRLDTGKSFDDTFLAPETRKQVANYAPPPPVPPPPGQTAAPKTDQKTEAPPVITDDDAGRAAYAKVPVGSPFVHDGILWEQSPQGKPPKYLGPAPGQQQTAEKPAAKPVSAAPMAMPASAKDAVDGQTYNTARGVAKWDSKQQKFIPVGGP